MTAPAYVTGLGAATALDNAVHAAAAARARLVRFGPVAGMIVIDDNGEEVPLSGAPAGVLTEGFEGDGRLIRLGIGALEDLERTAGAVDWARAGLVVALSAPPGVEPTWGSELVGKLRACSPLAGRLPLGGVHVDERTGTLRALAQALEVLRLGQLEHMVVLGIDSGIDERRWGAWTEGLRLKTPDNPVGFLPGEAAVAVLLSRSDAGEPAYANLRLSPPVVEREPPLADGRASGRGLSRVLLAAAASLPRPGAIVVDLNGEESRAHDFGCALARLPAGSPLRDAPVEIPGLAFGETGAVSPLLAILLGVRAFARGYAPPGDGFVVLVAADEGTRAAFTLERLQRRQGAPRG